MFARNNVNQFEFEKWRDREQIDKSQRDLIYVEIEKLGIGDIFVKMNEF